MAELTHKQYEALERAIIKGRRISAYRRGTEYIVIPERLRVIDDREAVEAMHPTTGEHITIFLDELESFEVIR